MNLTYFDCMKTTLNIDEHILSKASKMTGVREKGILIRLGLEALIAQESSRKLARLGGTEKFLRVVHRRKSGNGSR